MFYRLLQLHVFYSNKKLPSFKTVERTAYENGDKIFKSVKAGGFGYVDNSLQNKVHSHTFRNYSTPIPMWHKLKCLKKITRGKQSKKENMKYLFFLNSWGFKIMLLETLKVSRNALKLIGNFMINQWRDFKAKVIWLNYLNPAGILPYHSASATIS